MLNDIGFGQWRNRINWGGGGVGCETTTHYGFTLQHENVPLTCEIKGAREIQTRSHVHDGRMGEGEHVRNMV